MGFGSLQSGHAHPKSVEALSRQLAVGSVYGYEWERTPEVAERICRRYGMDKVRFSTTGLEAALHAVRFAREYTGRRYVLKFEGSYRGSHDGLLVGVKPRRRCSDPPTDTEVLRSSPRATSMPTSSFHQDSSASTEGEELPSLRSGVRSGFGVEGVAP